MKKSFSLVIFFITVCLHAQHNYDNQNTLYSLNGNVGVGISNPATKLHINGDIRGSRAGGALRVNGTFGYVDIGPLNNSGTHIYTNMPRFYFNKDVWSITNGFSSYNNDLILRTIGTEKVRIKNQNGNMGIGIEDPKAKLHINGGIRGNRAGGAVRINGTFGYVDIGPLNNSGTHIYTDMPRFYFNKDVWSITNGFSSYNDDLILRTRGIERLRINDVDGSVGIATTNTRGYKLAVNGNIRAQEIVVEIAQWPDYVFKKEYELPTLKQVAAHIKSNGHLPNIPSEKEVAENGISLGQINGKLLEKIEELTLYTIQQEEKLQILQQALTSIQKELEVLKTNN